MDWQRSFLGNFLPTNPVAASSVVSDGLGFFRLHEERSATMTRVLPPLHEGHAPIYLLQAFAEAVDAFELWDGSSSEPMVQCEGRQVPISSVFGRMRTCSDILPFRLREAVVEIVGEMAAPVTEHPMPTYAVAAVPLRALCVERLKGMAA